MLVSLTVEEEINLLILNGDEVIDIWDDDLEYIVITSFIPIEFAQII